jgi:hypothetical protein
MRRWWLGTVVVFCAAGGAHAQDVLPSVGQRLAEPNASEVPSFQRHVVPLLGHLGCNGRACHGSFQGQGGFRLSLFGYDFKADHEALLGGENPRVNLKDPQASLALLKPTRTMAHKGGKRMEKDGWEHQLLLRWIKAGAPAVKETDPAFVSLEVEPREITFANAGQTARVKVVARWADGTLEDVTPLCRFRSNDEAIAAVDDGGLVTSTGKGGTDVIAFYDNGVVPVQATLPVSDRVGDRYPKVPTPTKVDELVVARLRKLGIVPSELCSDGEFLRRVSLDLTGTLPTPAEVTAFLSDTSADKRAKKIDELLARPAYAAWWATRLCDWTGNSEATGPLGGERGLNREKSKQWYQWIYRRVADNVPYDKLVEGIVLATSRRPSQSHDDYYAEMSSYFRKDKPGDFAARENLPYFWMRRQLGKPDGKALAFAHAFLGVSLQCAECHKHPYDQWTKQDFDQFAAFFNGVGYREGNRDQVREMKKKVGLTADPDSGGYARQFVELAEAGTVLPFKELTVPPAAKRTQKSRPGAKGPAGRVITPKLLGGEEVLASRYDDPRQPLMEWMRQDDNPYFARAFVNRVWANYFNVGLIDPPDDLNLANPPSNPALLDYLAQGFINSGYDMKWLHREITRSRTYQLGWRPNDTNKQDERNFSRAVLRRLPAEVLYDALTHATASDQALEDLGKDPLSKRAIGFTSGYSNRGGGNYAVNLFGKPARVLKCDCERSSEPSLLQTVFLRNDQEVLKMLDRGDGRLKQVGREKDQDLKALVSQAYLRTLSRQPDSREVDVALTALREAEDTMSGLRDLLWALLNTKEFIVNH